jgi:hypothetical protein
VVQAQLDLAAKFANAKLPSNVQEVLEQVSESS